MDDFRSHFVFVFTASKKDYLRIHVAESYICGKIHYQCNDLEMSLKFCLSL